MASPFTPTAGRWRFPAAFWEKQAESSLLDLATKKLRALPWTANHDHILKGVAMSPDGNILVADCYRSIQVGAWRKIVSCLMAGKLLKCFVLSLAFSPDGKTLITCGAPMRGHNDQLTRGTHAFRIPRPGSRELPGCRPTPPPGRNRLFLRWQTDRGWRIR